MRRLIFISITATALLLVSCSGLQVTSDYDNTVNFTQYSTISFYGWAEDSDAIMSQFTKSRIEKAFQEQFERRGLTFVKEGGDLIASLYIVTEQKVRTTAHTTHMGGYRYGYGGYYGYGPGWGWGGGYSHTTYTDTPYTTGTLIVSVFDSEKEQLVWESVGNGNVQENTRSEERVINFYVNEIMKPYPIKPQRVK